MELANVIILYFKPNSKLGNSMSVFKNYKEAKKDKTLNLFVHYLVYWVAGVKLIFILLLLVILFVGNQVTKVGALITMIFSVTTYYWKLHPLIKKLDKMNKITPKGYSKTLGLMIGIILMVFILSLIIYYFK